MNKKAIKISIVILLAIVSFVFNENSINLYVADGDVSKLTLQKTDIPKENLAEIISETIKLNQKCFNQDTKVLNITVKDRIAYVDLSKEFDDPDTNSSALARLKVFFIVNGLCLNKSLNIDEVYLLIEGKKQESVAGIVMKDGGSFTGREY